MQKHYFPNPTALNLGDALGIPKDRQNEIGQQLDAMVASFGGVVYAAQIVQYMESFCKTPEEFLYAYNNHMAWHYRRGSAVPAMDGNIRQILDGMTDEQRTDIFRQYCQSCGGKDPSCQCWNNE
jgi:hypothetical protein